MEIKATLNKPYSDNQRMDFIVEQNHQKGYEIKETSTALEAWGYTEEELAEKERERISRLSLTRGDVFRGLLQAKGVTKAQLRAGIEAMPEGLQKEMALIDFDEALNFFRGNPLVDTVGATLGITSEQLDKFFETNDYHELEAEETPQNGEENIGEDNSTQTEETLENTPDSGTENEDLDNNNNKENENDNQSN